MNGARVRMGHVEISLVSRDESDPQIRPGPDRRNHDSDRATVIKRAKTG